MSSRPKSSKSSAKVKSSTSSKQDLISIIIPCYNVEEYIEKCINSIKNQSYSNFVAFIIDEIFP